MGNARIPGPLSQIDQRIAPHPGVIALTSAALPGPTGTAQIVLGPGGNPVILSPSLVRLEVSGAQRLPDGHQTPANTTNWAVTPETSPLSIRAITLGGVPPLTWAGDGKETSDLNDEMRLLDIRQPGKFVVTCTDGKWRTIAVIYVLWARMTAFKGDGGGTFDSDNIKSLRRKDGKTINTQGKATGRQLPAAATLDFNDMCETQYTLVPPEFLADGNSNLFDAKQTRFLVTRRKQTKAFLGGTIGPWVRVQEDAGFVDDTDVMNSMLDPFNASGHLYSNDGPGLQMTQPLSVGDRVVIKHRLRELIKITFDGSSPVSGTTCSDEFSWHDFRSLEFVACQWKEASTFGGNELTRGDKDFAPLPTPK
jgi:hypothetical protein